jgi:hypothetical protein
VATPTPVPATAPTLAVDGKNSARELAITQASFEPNKPSSIAEPSPVRKSFVDISAHPCFSHNADYTSLTGQLQYSRHTKAWRLRYASVDEVDPYGGSVTVADDSRLTGMKDGDYVRVQGSFVNSADQGIAPPYEVSSIQLLTKQD